jgi:Transcription factor WhiB
MPPKGVPTIVLEGLHFPNLPGARCATGISPEASRIPPDWFYAEEVKYVRIRKRAKAFCGPCPVRKECLQWALQNDEQWGVWGGLDTRERRKLLKRRAR